jgi:tRNA/tmRNA/rRNA uracil-C5-methylase (TrmA/RlmC/RlmD family)
MGEIIEVIVERPVAGGRMLARHDGAVVLVAGAIPGERVRARVTRATRSVTLAETIEVLEASPDRRTPGGDPRCGGMFYAHIAYGRQRQLKGEVIADAFRRLGKLTLDAPPEVAASPETGYRLRARLHVRHGRAGFFLEGTHTLCDAAATGQLRADTWAAVESLLSGFGHRLGACESLIVAENVSATERVVHLDPKPGARIDDAAIDVATLVGVNGITAGIGGRIAPLGGSLAVTDTASDLFFDAPPVPADVTWTRRAASFFQGNRYLTGSLVAHVLRSAAGAARVVDLYAGVGLFAVAFAASGARVVAIEGDRTATMDLEGNARPWGDRLVVEHRPVEDPIRHSPAARPDVVVLDPPRTGASRDALAGVIAFQATRVVYVSCDPPTLARDAAHLGDAGYVLQSIAGFDLFPNTPHVETVAVFDRNGAWGL